MNHHEIITEVTAKLERLHQQRDALVASGSKVWCVMAGVKFAQFADEHRGEYLSFTLVDDLYHGRWFADKAEATKATKRRTDANGCPLMVVAVADAHAIKIGALEEILATLNRI